jgi:hypothetical protein
MASKPDLSEFFKYSRPKRKPCCVGYALEQLDEPQQTQLQAALSHDAGIITNAAVVQWLAARKHTATVSAVVNHRKGVCACADGS